MHRQDNASIGGFIVPAGRVENLVTTKAGDDVLVYDQDRHHIHHLNPTAAAVWTLCNGRRSVSDISQATGFDSDAVRLALRKLEEANLLDGPLAPDVRGAMQSRRSFMKKAAVAGLAVPMIASISAPAASAQTSTGSCTPTICPPGFTPDQTPCTVCENGQPITRFCRSGGGCG